MELTRRDAFVALAALGAGSAAVGQRRDPAPDSETVMRTLVAVAEVLYPERVDVTESFVTTYVRGRSHVRSDFEAALADAVAVLDRRGRGTHDRPFADLGPDRRRAVIRRLGVDRVRANPDGTDAQRVRYFVVHELLYALYASPVGGRLLGIENPPGYPGGRAAYQRGPGGT